MKSNTSSKKEEEDDDVVSREASPRTSISSNASNFIVQSPSIANTVSDTFNPSRHSIDELRDLHQLSRQALSRRLSTLSTTSSFGDIGDGNLNWNPREAGVNGMLLSFNYVFLISQLYRMFLVTYRHLPLVRGYPNPRLAKYLQSPLQTSPSSLMRPLSPTSRQ